MGEEIGKRSSESRVVIEFLGMCGERKYDISVSGVS